uniref:hypothetical protein n=1 Tax=Acinetobacter sp. TaxID=472 RepID=UPI00388D0D7F
MTAKKEVKPPKQLRLTFRDQTENEYDENWNIVGKLVLPRLGFAQEYNPNVKTFEKRKHTQDYWAYGGGGCVTSRYSRGYFEVDGKMWERRGYRELKPGVRKGSRCNSENSELI